MSSILQLTRTPLQRCSTPTDAPQEQDHSPTRASSRASHPQLVEESGQQRVTKVQARCLHDMYVARPQAPCPALAFVDVTFNSYTKVMAALQDGRLGIPCMLGINVLVLLSRVTW
jgi:hypothetical protein